MEKTDAEWKKELTPEQYRVLREKGTEAAGSGEYHDFKSVTGHFACAACKAPLYSAQSKFDSGCGWPAFDQCFVGALKTNVDSTHGMKRIEIVCASCGGHLGHVFEGEKLTKSNERHCVNSVSIKFVDHSLRRAETSIANMK